MPGIGSVAVPKGDSRYVTRKARKLAKDRQWREVCEAVDRRDSHHCRVCGAWTNTEAVTLLERGHRHHLIYRSAGGPDESWNLATLCAECHDDEHGGRLQLSGNADHRDPAGRLCGIKVEKPGESGWEVVAWT